MMYLVGIEFLTGKCIDAYGEHNVLVGLDLLGTAPWLMSSLLVREVGRRMGSQRERRWSKKESERKDEIFDTAEEIRSLRNDEE